MASHFSRTIVRQLARKGIIISGGQAAPAFDGDIFFTAIAYGLVKDDCRFLRSYSEVVAIAEGRSDLVAS
jgi:hypothetical protein